MARKAKTFKNSVWVCVDCLFAMEYGMKEATQTMDSREIESRVQEIDAGLDKGSWCYIGDERLDATFSSAQCGCCGSYLAGSRFLAELEIDREWN